MSVLFYQRNTFRKFYFLVLSLSVRIGLGIRVYDFDKKNMQTHKKYVVGSFVTHTAVAGKQQPSSQQCNGFLRNKERLQQ